jgi:hypothetical protein
MRWSIVLVAVVVLGAACSGPEAAGGVDARPDRTGEQAELAYAQCMRDHGIDWPDPEYIDDEWQARPGEDVDLESPAFLTAESECAQARTGAGSGSGDNPEERAQLEEEMGRMLAFAACMREQGIDFPDPQFDDTGGISGPAGPLDGDTAAFDAARASCESRLGRKP